jgi:AsmA protein
MEARSSSKRKRWILIASAVVVAVLLAAVALPFLIDVNTFRPMLETRASQVVGRTVKLGTLKLSVFSGKLLADDVEVSDDPAFSKSAFLTAKSVEIGVDLMPLIFSKQLNVTAVVVDQPQVTVLQSPDGTFNFSSIGKGAQNSGASPVSTTPTVLVNTFRLTDGKLTVGRTDSSVASRVYDNFNLEADAFSFSSSFPFKLTMNLPGGGNAAISGNAGPIRLADILSTPFNASVKASAVNIAASGVVDPANGIAGMASVDETVMSDGNTTAATGTLNIAGAKLSPQGTPSPVPIAVKHNIEVDLRQQSVKVTQADIGIGKAQFHATGTVQSKGDAISVNLQLSGSDVPVDEIKAMLPSLGMKVPTGSRLQGGSVSAKLAISGSVGVRYGAEQYGAESESNSRRRRGGEHHDERARRRRCHRCGHDQPGRRTRSQDDCASDGRLCGSFDEDGVSRQRQRDGSRHHRGHAGKSSHSAGRRRGRSQHRRANCEGRGVSSGPRDWRALRKEQR